MAKLIDGKAVSASVRAQVAEEVEQLKQQGVTPGLAVVIVGDDPASRTYVNNKKKACAQTGIYSEEYALPATTTQEELMELIETLNNKKDINGILVQSPLPNCLYEDCLLYTSSSLRKLYHPFQGMARRGQTRGRCINSRVFCMFIDFSFS